MTSPYGGPGFTKPQNIALTIIIVMWLIVAMLGLVAIVVAAIR